MSGQEINQITNKRVIVTSVLLVILASLGYILEYIRGSRTLGYVLMLCAFIWIPILLVVFIYKMKIFATKFKEIALYSFLVSWMLMLALSPKVIQFVLIFPLIMIYLLYYDVKLMVRVSIIMVAFSFVKVGLNIRYYQLVNDFVNTEYSVFILSMIIFSVITISTTKFSGVIQKAQMSNILEEKRKNEALLVEIKEMISTMEITSENLNTIYEALITGSEEADSSIVNLTSGMQEIAASLDSQNENTENIQSHMEETNQYSSAALESATASVVSVENGKTTIDKLNHSAMFVNENNGNVNKKMTELKGNMNEIKNIIVLIQGIANHTNLLALNASIESARAGEAGKGFAVVAESIRDLALQTAKALEDINQLFSALELSANESIEAARSSVSLGEQQIALIKSSKDIYESIAKTMNQVNEGVKVSSKMNSSVVEENQLVTQRIQTINNVVHEVLSSAEKVAGIVGNNAELTKQAQDTMGQMNEVVNKLARYK